eukprot:Phypoly_transcript_15529.p1 GENE.Phypoly_transcript_15529~~Phypoly_transcript_15529.p1  ORF type:complete len:303 (+),score=36.19 Phypoly_transcript_15529:40-909(+)
MEPITSKIPYVVTPGNHEFEEYGDPIYYSNWFIGQTQLGKQSGSTNPTMWYSFDVGNVHIVAMSTEVYCADSKNLVAQHQWLENDLQSVRSRPIQPFLVVFGHRQMYIGPLSTFSSRLMRLGVQCNDSSLQHCDMTPCDSEVNCGYSLEQLLNKYSVDIFISGHVHLYARMFPIAPDYSYEPHNETYYINPQHPTYLISGAAGIQSEYPRELQKLEAEGLPDFTIVKSLTGFSYSHMQVFNSTHLYIKQIDVSTGVVVDDFWIIKDSALPKWNVSEKYILLPSTQVVCD